jgi:AraC family transcriptional regulator
MEYSFSDVRIEKLHTMYVASSYVISDNPEEDVINFMTKWMENNHINPKSRQYGFDIPVSEEQMQKGLRGYEYWVEVQEDTDLCEGIKLKKVDECDYAVLRITNPFSNPFQAIPAGWNKLVEWVKAKGYGPVLHSAGGHKERYCLEEKLEEYGVTYMDVYFPLN